MEKRCPDHGEFRALVWSDAKGYADWMDQSVHAEKNEGKEAVRLGCPFDCGLCDDHEGKTCTAVLEVTYRCNMNCPVCFTRDRKEPLYEPDLTACERLLRRYREE